MDPSIMKLLEEDEDETMHSGADVEAFTAALNRDIGGDNSQSQPSDSDSVPLSQGSSYTSNQFAPWQTSNHEENASRGSLQDSENIQPKEENLYDMQLKIHDTDSQNQQQKNDSSQEINSLPLQHISQDSYQTTEVERDTLHSSRAVNMQNPEKNSQNPESPHLNLQGANNLKSMQSLTTRTSGTEASNQSESATGSSSQAAMNVANQRKQVPFAMLFPHIQPHLDKDRTMQLQTLYLKFKKNEISMESFARHMRSIIGDKMLKMAVYKFQSQASKNSQTVPGQFPHSQASQQQHSQMPDYDSINMSIESKAQKLHEVENQADLHGAQGCQMPSYSLTVVKQERDRTLLCQMPSSRAVNMQNPEKNTQNPESPHLNVQGTNNLQSMQSLTTGTSGLPRVATEASNQSESTTGSSSQAAMNVAKQGKQVPFAMLFPHIQPQLDKDRAMQLQTLYLKLKKNEISKESFVRHMRSIIGDQMLKMAVYKFQSQASKNSQTVPGQFPQSQASQQQHSQMPADDSSNMPLESKAQKLHEVENQADPRGAQGSQMPSSSLIAVKQERDRTPFPIQGLNRQQQHLHFSQASFPTFSNAGNNYSAYSASNVNSSTTQALRQQSDDAQMRQISAQNRNATQFGVPTQAMGMMSAPKFEKQNTFGEAKRLPGGSLSTSSTSRIQQTSVQWQPSANKEQKSILSSPMTNPKLEPIDHFHDQLQRSQLSPFSSVQVDQGNSTSESSKDESIEQTSRILSTTTSMKPSNSASSSMSSHMDTSTLLSSRPPSVTSPLGPGNNGKTPVKKPSIGQKKPLDALGSSPPPSGKKQKVSGGFLDQSIEQLNDVTAVSGVDLRAEEEQLFSGPKEDSRVSEASRRVVQEEEERLILQKIPLQKKLTEIMAKCGLKNMSGDVERCLSLCVEERMRGLISSLIRLSKQRVDIEKSRHRTIVTSDVREEIMSINRKAREEWEKKQADVEKLQKANEPEGSIGVDGDKEKDEGRGKSIKVNKEEDDKMRTTAANVAARAAVGGDDMLSKWQLMAEQARQKREGGGDVASGSQPGKDVTRKNLSAPTRSPRDHQEAEKRSQSPAIATPGTVRRTRRNQGIITQTRIARSITVKDVIAVLEREPQMSKSTLIYRLYEKARSNASSAEPS